MANSFFVTVENDQTVIQAMGPRGDLSNESDVANSQSTILPTFTVDEPSWQITQQLVDKADFIAEGTITPLIPLSGQLLVSIRPKGNGKFVDADVPLDVENGDFFKVFSSKAEAVKVALSELTISGKNPEDGLLIVEFVSVRL